MSPPVPPVPPGSDLKNIGETMFSKHSKKKFTKKYFAMQNEFKICKKIEIGTPPSSATVCQPTRNQPTSNPSPSSTQQLLPKPPSYAAQPQTQTPTPTVKSQTPARNKVSTSPSMNVVKILGRREQTLPIFRRVRT